MQQYPFAYQDRSLGFEEFEPFLDPEFYAENNTFDPN